MLSINPPIFAHRGANQYAPENTLAAFRRAKELGVNWIEFDCMLSKDNQVVVMHDDKLDRTTNGHGLVHDYTREALSKFDAGSWFNPAFQYEKIPAFREVIDFLKTQKMGANVEIKPLPGLEVQTTEIILQMIREFWTEEMIPPIVSSFSEKALLTARKFSDDVQLGFLMDEWNPNWKTPVEQLKCVSVHLNEKITDRYRVAEIKSLGYCVFCYTVNDRMRAEELYAMGVDALFTDWPDELLHLF